MTLMQKINKIATDKLLHSHWGNVLFIASLLALMVVEKVVVLPVYAAFAPLAMVYLFAVGKELLDRRDPEHHTADVWDIVWTVYQPTLYSVIVLIFAGGG